MIKLKCQWVINLFINKKKKYNLLNLTKIDWTLDKAIAQAELLSTD